MRVLSRGPPVKRHPAPPFLARQVLGLLAPIVFTGPAFANKALAEKHGYLGCHAAATKLVGPPFVRSPPDMPVTPTRPRPWCRASETGSPASGVRPRCQRKNRSTRLKRRS